MKQTLILRTQSRFWRTGRRLKQALTAIGPRNEIVECWSPRKGEEKHEWIWYLFSWLRFEMKRCLEVIAADIEVRVSR